mmetsp:Transcript_5791/g.7811  ORF Transcript_5791/g.7811 Transcript_5791/m.7811 type:complete len:186 (+) Transcript_5791:100-657(+)
MAETAPTTQPTEQPQVDSEQSEKLAMLGKALESQATKKATTPTKNAAADDEANEEKADAGEDGEQAEDGEAPAKEGTEEGGEAPAKKKRKKKKNKKKKNAAAIAIDTGEKMSLTAAAFVPSGASTLPAQFQAAPTPAMPLPTASSSAQPAATTTAAVTANPFEKLNIAAKQFVPANLPATGGAAG